MKAKIFLCCILTAIISSVSVPLTARAEAPTSPTTLTYARADARDVYFCTKKDLNTALFAIPYTYCVQIISTDGDWYTVRYAEDAGIYRALVGYCLKANLTPLDTPPSNPYLNMPVTVTYKIEDNTGSLPVLNEINVTAAFYGTYYSGASAYSYVMYDNSFGYILGANDDYPLNEVPTTPEPETPASTSGGGNAKLIIALVLSALAVAALAILYFTGKKYKYVKIDK